MNRHKTNACRHYFHESGQISDPSPYFAATDAARRPTSAKAALRVASEALVAVR
jgi:hypothetical protein